MSLTSEEIQTTLSCTIQSIQKNMDEERKRYKDKIQILEESLAIKEGEINILKEKIYSSKKRKEDKEEIDSLKAEKENIKKELEKAISDYKTSLINISTLNNQLEIEKQNSVDLKLENKSLKEKCEKSENSYNILKNQFFLLEKQIDGHKDEINKFMKEIENKEKIIEELNIKIEETNKKIKEIQESNSSLLNYVKEIKEKDEMLKSEKEEMKKEKDKLEMIKKEIIQKKKEEIKRHESEKILKYENKEIVEIKSKNLEGQEKIITDLLCEFLLKLNNLQYFVSLFDLLDKTLKYYDELKYIYNLNQIKNESMNDILYNFYESLKSYFLVQQENATLNDFLLQKNFRLSPIEKEDIERIKTINSIKFYKEENILSIYRKKRELFFKSKEFTFNVLKEKILSDNKKEISGNHNEFLRITKPPLELQVNIDEIIDINYSLTKYQSHIIFSKLRELTLHISNIPTFLIYSLIINCPNLNSLKIIFIKKENEQQNSSNIEKLNDIFPVILNHLKKLKKEDISPLIPFFSQNSLYEIDLSNHSFNFPSFLNNSLLNYNINNQLTSICFNNCKLNEADIKSITNYIVSSTSLIICDIGKNILSPLACSTFGYCILKTTSLETLRINECGINGESLLFIFNGKGSKPLKHVNLNGNEFGDIGLVSISAFMKNSPLLQSIELEKCGGTDMGFISLVNMIQGNIDSKIKYVNFHKNNVTVASLGILQKYNDAFRSRKVVFALDKMEGKDDNIDIDCAIFT